MAFGPSWSNCGVRRDPDADLEWRMEQSRLWRAAYPELNFVPQKKIVYAEPHPLEQGYVRV